MGNIKEIEKLIDEIKDRIKKQVPSAYHVQIEVGTARSRKQES